MRRLRHSELLVERGSKRPGCKAAALRSLACHRRIRTATGLERCVRGRQRLSRLQWLRVDPPKGHLTPRALLPLPPPLPFPSHGERLAPPLTHRAAGASAPAATHDALVDTCGLGGG